MEKQNTLNYLQLHTCLLPKSVLSFYCSKVAYSAGSLLPCLTPVFPPTKTVPLLMILPTTLHYHYKIICFIMPFWSWFYLQSMSCYADLLKLWFFFSSPLLAVDLSIRRGESQGVIHDSLIDEDFNLIWFVNFNCPQSAFCAVFCNTRPWNVKNRLPLNNGISQFLQN